MSNAQTEIIGMNSAHIEELSKLHMDAFRGYSNTKIGRNYVKKFLNWFVNFPEGIALTALFDGTPAGYVVGAPVGYQSKMNKDLAGVAFTGFVSHPWVIFNMKILSIALSRVKILFGKKEKKIAEKRDENAISLVGIAVSPLYSGHKIGSKLMTAFEELARAKEYDLMRLSVYDYNEAAISMYKKSGWSELGSSNSTLTFIKQLHG